MKTTTIDRNGRRTIATLMTLMLIACEKKSPQAARPTPTPDLPAASSAAPLPKGAQAAEDAFRRGTALGKAGKYQQAIRAYSESIELVPAYTSAYLFRGLTHRELGDFEAAIRDLNKVVSLDPSADSYRTRADSYARHGDLDKAIADYNKVLELDPKSASGFRNRGTAYGEKKNYERAIEDLSRAIELEPQEAQWVFDRAMLKAKHGQYDAAMIDAEKALALSGGVPNLRPGEGRAVTKLNFDCQRLVADLERAGAKRR